MNIVPSRFACLRIEDDENSSESRIGTGATKKEKSLNNGVITCKERQKATKSANKAASKQPEVSAKKQRAAKRSTAKQWEEWKEKDKKLVDGRFEQDLENAIFMSKISYEENKYKCNDKDEKLEPKKTEKKKKHKVLSLDQFLSNDENTLPKSEPPINEECNTNKNFFEEVIKETKSELTRDHFIEQFRERQQSIDYIITASQYEEKLTLERKKNESLQNEVETLKNDVITVKERNKTLYSLLSTGEMKGKVEIINELEKLKVIKDELTQEVSRLYGLLEQERSKVAAFMDNKKRKNGKR